METCEQCDALLLDFEIEHCITGRCSNCCEETYLDADTHCHNDECEHNCNAN